MEQDKPIRCPYCNAQQFELEWDANGWPWWCCPNKHRIFGYWRTEAQVKRALKQHKNMLGDCLRSSWIARTSGGRDTIYAPWEAIIDTKVDLEGAMKVLDWGERALVKLRYEDGMSVRELAGRYGVWEFTVRRWFTTITRKLAMRIGSKW